MNHSGWSKGQIFETSIKIFCALLKYLSASSDIKCNLKNALKQLIRVNFKV